jgi:hypothetical protein
MFAEVLKQLEQTGTVKLRFAFTLLVIADSAFEQEAADSDLATEVCDTITRVLTQTYDEKVYEATIGWLAAEIANFEEILPQTALDKFRRANHYVKVWSPMAFLLPFLSGDLLLFYLNQHLNASLMPPIVWRDDLLMLLHLYRMLRKEGYLERITAIESSLIRTYSQNVFFRSGFGGKNPYSQNYQFALGHSATNAARGRHLGKGGRSKRIARDQPTSRPEHSMSAVDVSRLKQIEILEDVPLVDRAACFDEIHQISVDECPSILLSPLMEITVRLKAMLEHDVVDLCRDEATRYIHQFRPNAQIHSELGMILNWATALGEFPLLPDHQKRALDEYSGGYFSKERDEGLSLLAECFAEWFDVSATDPVTATDTDVNFKFNTDVRKLDKGDIRSLILQR